MNSEILSFYLKKPDGEVFSEPLRIHIKTALDIAEKVLDSRLERLANHICKDIDFEDLLRISIILHDSGKAFFQQNIRRKNSEEYLSFAGHEFISAIIAEIFTLELSDELNPSSYFRTAITFSIYYHHHAMNPSYRKRHLIEACRIAKENYSRYSEELEKIIENFLTKNKRHALKRCMERLNVEKQNIIDNVFVENHLKRRLDDALIKKYSPELRKLSLLLLDSLIVCDYMAAWNRGENISSTFSKAVKMFYDLWFY
ncbi:MAG: CRISPR-associated endonuclease Cas3'' [Nitrososphaerota archaeon]